MLRLETIEKTFPESWLEFAPSPAFRYIEHARGELLALGVMQPDDKSFAGFCGVPRYFHPRADEEALILSLELICWYFYFDDPFDDGVVAFPSGSRLCERMLAVLERGELNGEPTPTERLCARFRARALRMAGGETPAVRRFLSACADWVGSILPINRQRHATVPTLGQYDALRLINVGILPEFPLNEVAHGLQLDDEFVDSPEVRRLAQLAAMIIAYCNDIYSYEREAERCTQLNSLELRRAGGSLDVAYAEQVADIRNMVEQFVAIEERLARRGVVGLAALRVDPEPARRLREQKRYVEDMRAIIIGNHVWSLNDGRYHSANSPFEELRRATPRKRRGATESDAAGA